jgi:hypothetical protein
VFLFDIKGMRVGGKEESEEKKKRPEWERVRL